MTSDLKEEEKDKAKDMPPAYTKKNLMTAIKKLCVMNEKICWILWLSNLTRIFEMPNAIGLAAGNMYAQNVH
jgi:hypothetical protein